MFRYLLIPLILLLFVHPTQHNKNSQRNDTVFLQRENIGKLNYHIVYIEKNRSSRYYRNLFNFSITEKMDSDGYAENIAEIRKSKIKVKKIDLKGLPRMWMPVERYKNRYYSYYPSEWGNIGRYIFTDSTLVYWSMESPTPYVIKQFRQTDSLTYDVQLDDRLFFGEFKQWTHIIIHIIDRKTYLAVWEYPLEKSPYKYQLHMPKQYAANLDMIVNYCRTNKEMEYTNFDKINYKNLIKESK